MVIEALLVCHNICIWIIDSTVKSKMSLNTTTATSSSSSTLNGWAVVFNIALPLIIFYRFNSAVLLVSSFLTHYEQMSDFSDIGL